MRQAVAAAAFLLALPVLSQSSTGELRLSITDPAGSALMSTVELVSQGNEYRNTFTTDDQGTLDAKRLPYGIYKVRIGAQGFAEDSETIEIRSALPMDRSIRLKLGSVSASVEVTVSGTLIDPYRAGSVNEMGPETIQNRLAEIGRASCRERV